MEKFLPILHDIWREACRHIEITASLPAITGILRQHLPLQQLRILRLQPDSGDLRTLACGMTDAANPVAPVEMLDVDDCKSLTAWRRADLSGGPAPPLPPKLLKRLTGEHADTLLTPLAGPKDGHAILLCTAPDGVRFTSRHRQMVQRIKEPLATALENDARLRELVALREAALADKNSLLTKLSRRDMDDSIVGANGGLKRVMERIRLVAGSDVPVLIFGETGTGKELVARTIHNQSDRCNGPVMRVNCGAIPTELIDSHLFGHERGAFTGAYESRKGWFERADKGTLFLDEVGELPLQAQVRLLRVLQDGWIERVGGKQPIRVNVRIVLATHRDLAAMVAQGSFREDLWYRIATFPIYLPPLRERTQDMRDLAEHFSKRSAHRFGLPEQLPTDADIDLLNAYPWPGNIRELSAVIDRAALLGNGARLDIVTALGWQKPPLPAPVLETRAATETIPDAPLETLDAVMKAHIEKALLKCHGRVEGKRGAAALLGINANTLRARMRKLHVDWRAFREEEF